MTKSARLAASCLFAVAFLASSRAADTTAPAGPVIERAPETDPAAELASLREQNKRLAAELAAVQAAHLQDSAAVQDSTRELATLRAKLARLEKTPGDAETLQQKLDAAQAALASRTHELNIAQAALATAETRAKELAAKAADPAATTQLSAEKARAEELNARLATLQPNLEQLQQEKAALEQQLAAARTAETSLRQQIAAAPATPAPSVELTAKLSAAETKLAETERQVATVTAENQLLKTAATSQTELTTEMQQLRQDKAALEQKLAAIPAAAPAPAPAAENPETAAKLAEAENKLATTLRSYSLLQAENDQLKTAVADHEKLTSDLASLRQEKSALETRLADAEKTSAAPAEPAPDLTSRLADVENKLSTALRSYSLLQTENDQLKADAARAADTAQASAAKSSSESAAQISALYDSLRQTQAQAVALAAENSQLKTRLALAGGPPGTTLSSPSRPGATSSTLTPTSLPDPVPPAPAAAPAPRTHVVQPGDTLGKISRQYYGTASRYEEILRANRDVIKNENSIPLGATLRIP